MSTEHLALSNGSKSQSGFVTYEVKVISRFPSNVSILKETERRTAHPVLKEICRRRKCHLAHRRRGHVGIALCGLSGDADLILNSFLPSSPFSSASIFSTRRRYIRLRPIFSRGVSLCFLFTSGAPSIKYLIDHEIHAGGLPHGERGNFILLATY